MAIKAIVLASVSPGIMSISAGYWNCNTNEAISPVKKGIALNIPKNAIDI